MSQTPSSSPSRRDMLQGLMALAGATSLTACGIQTNSSSGAQPTGPVSYPIGDPRNGAAGGHYTEALQRFVSAVADTILPNTDTPGAVAAGVPERLQLVLTEWLDHETRVEWLTAVSDIEAELNTTGEQPFVQAGTNDRTSRLRAFDEAAYGSSQNSAAHSKYRRLKQEVLTAYYTTEVGCTEELQWLDVPGDWKSCVPLSEIGRTWAAHPYR